MSEHNLITAIQNKDAKLLLKLLQEQEKIEEELDDVFGFNYNQFGGISLLHWASELGSKECLQILLESKKHRELYGSTNINKKDDVGATPLHYASGEGKIECIKLLLEKKATINIADFGGETPLHWACLNGHKECTSLLLDKGANINAVADNGFTPLHSAAINNHGSCVSVLLGRGADATIKDKKGKTAKEIAQERNMTNLVDYFTPEKGNTLDRLSYLETEVISLREELTTTKEQKEDLSRRLTQKFKDEIENEKLLKATQSELMKAQEVVKSEQEKRQTLETELKQVLDEYKDMMRQNMELEQLIAELKQQQQLRETDNNNSSSSSATVATLDVKDPYKLVQSLTSLQQLLNNVTSAVTYANSAIDETTVQLRASESK